MYRGVWARLVAWFRVPETPPTLPVVSPGRLRSFRPSAGFLRYMKFQFWIALTAIDLLLCAAWLVLIVAVPLVGLAITPLALALIVVPDLVAYLAIHLRFDTTWYVISPRSLRIRRGIWVIHETTITFDNVQNVVVRQGPLQRYFGIADVLVETAGGGGGGQAEHQGAMGAHFGLLEGVDNAPEIRDLIRGQMRQSKSSGLGELERVTVPGVQGLTSAHVALLREIRDLLPPCRSPND